MNQTEELIKSESVIVLGVRRMRQTWADAEAALEELKTLAQSAGAVVLDAVMCDIERINCSTFLGSGKVQELKQLIGTAKPDTLVFDESLTPAQQRNLENQWNVHVIDRTGIILDIFARRAGTKEGILQVELAQLQYRLPRLTRMWTHLSRLGAGIGTRGPGETQLEVDRRKIRQKISRLKKDLEKIKKRRRLQRKARKQVGSVTAAIVGYTNAGKSTLLNRLTGSSVKVMDKVFATLDPTVRVLKLPNNQNIAISDTVGFISKLPHQLVAAFRATLEEVSEADLLLHVVDGSTEYPQVHIEEVEKVLKELGAVQKPRLLLYNKLDLMDVMDSASHCHHDDYLGAIAISARRGDGIDELLDFLMEFNNARLKDLTFEIPYSKSEIIARLRDSAEVTELIYNEDAVQINARVKPSFANKYREYIVEGNETR